MERSGDHPHEYNYHAHVTSTTRTVTTVIRAQYPNTGPSAGPETACRPQALTPSAGNPGGRHTR
jgi:hypothetical protein